MISMMFSQVVPATAALLLLFSVFYRLGYRGRLRGLPYPPGPKSRFITGNIRDLPRDQRWLTYTKWKQLYGDIVYLTVFGASIIVLNSADVVNDLLDKKGSIYSDRPRFPMANELMGWEWALSLMPYGKRFMTHRKIVQQQFQANVVRQSHQPIITKETRSLLANLAENPNDFLNHLRRTVTAIVVMATYGYQVLPKNDQFVSLSDEVRHVDEMAAKQGPYLVNKFPLLKHIPAWFPGAKFKRNAREWKKVTEQMRRRPYGIVKEQMAAGTALPSMVSSLLESDVDTGAFEREEVIMNCAGVVYGAGVDTTVAVLTNFFLAMQLYPDVQKKAQHEIDALTGGKRLPDFTDRNALPYMEAVVKENTRWRPVAPSGVPHRTTQDDVYNSMFIPCGTTVIPNIWAILHDDEVYQSPEIFIPERFIPSESSPTGAPDPGRAAFGFGRRICPGRYLADAVAWLIIARVLSVFRITPALDEDGRDVVPEVKWSSSGIVSAPGPFGCSIKPRSQGVIETL